MSPESPKGIILPEERVHFGEQIGQAAIRLIPPGWYAMMLKFEPHPEPPQGKGGYSVVIQAPPSAPPRRVMPDPVLSRIIYQLYLLQRERATGLKAMTWFFEQSSGGRWSWKVKHEYEYEHSA